MGFNSGFKGLSLKKYETFSTKKSQTPNVSTRPLSVSAVSIVYHPFVLTLQTNILIYIQQDATLHNLYYLETALHVSGGTTTQHQERKQLYLQHLVFVTP